MVKKIVATIVFIVILLVSMLNGFQLVELTKANFIILPTEPNTDPPQLIVHSPLNGSSYHGEVTLDFTLIKPVSWEPQPTANGGKTLKVGGIANIHYIIDNLPEPHYLYEEETNPIALDELPRVSNFSKTIKGLPAGEHSIQLVVSSLTWYSPDNSGIYGTSKPPFYYPNITIADTISFAIEPEPTSTISPSPSPSPTHTPIIEPTVKPTSTPKPQSGFLGTNLPTEYGYAIIAVLVVAVVAGLSLVYFKKIRK